MSDNKNINDEYQYIEESESPVEPEDTSAEFEFKESNPFVEKFQKFMTGSPLVRNSIIVVFAVIILGIIAKCSGSEVSKPKTSDTKPLTPVAKAPPIDAQAMSLQSQNSTQLFQAQQDLQTSVGNLTQQINQLSATVNNMSNTLQNYPQDIMALQVKLNQVEQSMQDLKAMMSTKKVLAKPVVKPAKTISAPSFAIPTTTYYIQAIIPGRAWLINSNGETLTVSVGSKVPGYGVVETIDAIQGIVEVSSNRVLRFNQSF